MLIVSNGCKLATCARLVYNFRIISMAGSVGFKLMRNMSCLFDVVLPK